MTAIMEKLYADFSTFFHDFCPPQFKGTRLLSPKGQYTS